MKRLNSRIEEDSLGIKEIPHNVYYGIQTMRAIENFPISNIPVSFEMIIALAEIKKAAAKANMQTDMLPKNISDAIICSANEIINGKLLDNFIVDSFQGGAGTSINMNMNEVLANRSLEILGKEKGEYSFCSPNTHVNMSQSTNDTISSALKIASIRMANNLLDVMTNLKEELTKKSEEFNHILKVGRTHLQDAVPIRLGQEFEAYSQVIGRDISRVKQATQGLLSINMGATAVGTGINARPEYTSSIITELSKQIGVEFKLPKSLVDGTQNTDSYTTLSSALKISVINISKICNDLRLMASGPKTGLQEINLPVKQPGSSIMPGKVNPVMVEVVNQVAFQVVGNDQTISMASEAGQFELNVMEPVIIFNLLQSLKIMKNSFEKFTHNAISGIEANIEKCHKYIEESHSIITALNPFLGYETSSKVIKKAITTGLTIKEVCLADKLLSENELEYILDPYEMTSPGFPAITML